MKKTLLISLLFASLLCQAQSILKAGCGEYGRYLINATDSSVYEDYWNGQAVAMTKTNTQGERMIDIAGALYSAVGVSSAGNAWVFGQGSITPTRITTDAAGSAFTGNTACAGYFYTYVTVRKGQLWYWGTDDMKFFGGKTIANPVQLTQPAGVTFTRVRMGNVILALSTTGDLWQYDLGNPNPHKIALPGAATDFATSHTGFYLAIVNGDPYGWGPEYRYMGLFSQPAAPTNLHTTWGLTAPIVRITANHNTIHFIDNQGRLFGMGDNAMGEVGNGQELVNRSELYTPVNYPQAKWYVWNWTKYGMMVSKPVQVGPAGVIFADIYADESYAFYHYAKDKAGKLYSWGRGKSWVQGHDWSPSDAFPNGFDITSPTLINPFAAGSNTNMGAFVVGKVSAGADHQVIGTMDTLAAAGTATTSYKIVSWTWRQLGGQAATMGSPDQQKSIVRYPGAGNYSFQVLVTDNNGATIADTVNATVTIPNIPPIAVIAPVDTITLPADSVVLDVSGSHDADGSIVSYAWSQLSGPSTTSIDNAKAARVQVGKLQAGTYVFQAQVTDNDGLIGSASIAVIVKPKPTIIKVAIYYSDGSVIIQQ